MAYMPIDVDTAESIAPTGAGAAETASGFHAWKGIIAAFIPKPAIISPRIDMKIGDLLGKIK